MRLIAKINGEPVYAKEFEERLSFFSQKKIERRVSSNKALNQSFNQVPLDKKSYVSYVFSEFIISKLIESEAKKRKIIVYPEEVESILTNWEDTYPYGASNQMLNKQNISRLSLSFDIQESLMISKLLNTMFESESKVSDDEAKNYFSSHAEAFTLPLRLHTYHIVLGTEKEARDIVEQLKKGDLTFESAARQYSISPDALRGGDMGVYSEDEKPNIFHIASKIKVGEFSEPIPTHIGFQIIKVLEKIPPQTLSFETAKSNVIFTMHIQRQKKIFKEWMTKLLKESVIVRNETVFSKFSSSYLF